MWQTHTVVRTIQGVNIHKEWNQDRFFYVHPFNVFYREDIEEPDIRYFESLAKAETDLISVLENELC